MKITIGKLTLFIIVLLTVILSFTGWLTIEDRHSGLYLLCQIILMLLIEVSVGACLAGFLLTKIGINHYKISDIAMLKI